MPRPVDAALEYARDGWAVFPCHSASAGSCSCRSSDCSSPGKHPATTRGLLSACTDAAQIRRWWDRAPASNIGVRTGAASGIVVVDIDPAHGGSRTIKALMDRHGDLAGVPRVRTGAGGWHLFFAHPGEPVRNSAGRLGPGLDVRGDGGYVIAPPSVHASGNRYRWEIPAVSLPTLPGWLFELTNRPTATVPVRPFAPVPPGVGSTGWARAALDAELRGVRTATQGSRNMTLNRAAFCLGQIVGAGLLDQHAVERLLVESGIGVGLAERESIITVRSGLTAGLAHPRRPASTHANAPEHHRAHAEDGIDISP